jgi:hypothetical protein
VAEPRCWLDTQKQQQSNPLTRAAGFFIVSNIDKYMRRIDAFD